MLTKIDPRLRATIYAGLVFGGVALVAWGVLTQETVDAVVPVLGGLLAVTGGGVAVRNVGDTPAAKETQAAIDGVVASIPTILSTIDSIQRELQGLPPVVTDRLTEYVPAIAPWLDPAGKHRLDG